MVHVKNFRIRIVTALWQIAGACPMRDRTMAWSIRSSLGVQPARIRIKSVPPGAAPLWVREKWVGVELVSVLGATPKQFLGASVLTKNSFLASLGRLLTGQTKRVTGYPVQVTSAIEALEKSSPRAAAWWRENTPGQISPGRLFVFDAGACELVTDAPKPSMFDR
ncbi:MAG TPA: hypothetical protein VHY79_00790 [Rhizomicrobium sp.]|jgi:hypothetical protein|nr:hypothetical protein [Rhizomicrobium sp.]